MRTHRRPGVTVLGLAALALLVGEGRARAALMLTPAGQAQGFSLTTFASGFPVAPIGISYPGSGVVLVGDYNTGNVYRFPTDTDNQVASSSMVLASYGGVGNAHGLVSFNGTTYMTQKYGGLSGTGAVVTVNPNTGAISTIIGSGLAYPLDIVANPINGHLFVSNGSGFPGIVDVNPVAKTFTTFQPVGADGLTISPNGATLYAEVGSHILGYDTTTKAQVFDSGLIPGNADGTALGFGTLAGKLFANTNGGTLVEIDLATKAQSVIASGGSRGDFTKGDPYNGSLLLTQTNSVLRLTAPPGGGFGDVSSLAPVPEPSSFALLALGGLALAGYRRWRKRQATA